MSNFKILNYFLIFGIVCVNIKQVNNTIHDIYVDSKSNFINVRTCVLNVIDSNFKRNATIRIFSSTNFKYIQMGNILIDELFHSLKWTISLYSQMNRKRLTPLGDRRNVIIMLGDKNLKLILSYLHAFYSWDSNAAFMIIVENLENQKGIKIENSTSYTNVTELTAMITVLHMRFNDSTLDFVNENYISIPNDILTNHPFETIIKIGSCRHGDSTINSLRLRSKFTERKLKIGAINSPPFLVITKPDNKLSGSEIRLINSIADKLNVTIDFQYYSNMDNLGDVFDSDDGNYGFGMLNDLLLHKIDVAIGNIIISQQVYKYLGVSTAYSVDHISIIIPQHYLHFKLQFFPFIFDFKTTLFLVSMYWIFPFLANLATNYFHDANNERSRYRTFRGTCITYFAMSTGATIDIHPKTIRMRLFFVIWLFYTYHLNMFFASTLIAFFSRNEYGSNMKTIQEVVSSGWDVGVDKRTVTYFKDNLNPNDNFTIHDQLDSGKINYCNFTDVCLSRIARDKNFSMSLSHNYFSFAKHLYENKNGQLLLTSLPANILTIPIGLVFQKGFPLERQFNNVILRLNEAGLFNYWSSGVRHKMHLHLSESVDEEINTNYSLKFNDLKMVFITTIAELLACILIFIGELIWDIFKKRRIEKKNCENVFKYVH